MFKKGDRVFLARTDIYRGYYGSVIHSRVKDKTRVLLDTTGREVSYFTNQLDLVEDPSEMEFDL